MIVIALLSIHSKIGNSLWLNGIKISGDHPYIVIAYRAGSRYRCSTGGKTGGISRKSDEVPIWRPGGAYIVRGSCSELGYLSVGRVVEEEMIDVLPLQLTGKRDGIPSWGPGGVTHVGEAKARRCVGNGCRCSTLVQVIEIEIKTGGHRVGGAGTGDECASSGKSKLAAIFGDGRFDLVDIGRYNLGYTGSVGKHAEDVVGVGGIGCGVGAAVSIAIEVDIFLIRCPERMFVGRGSRHIGERQVWVGFGQQDGLPYDVLIAGCASISCPSRLQNPIRQFRHIGWIEHMGRSWPHRAKRL